MIGVSIVGVTVQKKAMIFLFVPQIQGQAPLIFLLGQDAFLFHSQTITMAARATAQRKT